MKSKYLLLTLLSSAGLIAADTATPSASASETPRADAVAAPKSKVPGVADEDYQRFINARNGLEAKDPQLIALKAAAAEAKKKAKETTDPEAKKAADKEARAADKAFSEARKAAVATNYPELKDISDKVHAYWAKETAEKNKKKKAAEAAATASPDAKK